MGQSGARRRSRKRRAAGAANRDSSRKRTADERPATPAPAKNVPAYRAPADQRPQAPWHPVPVTEIAIAAGLVAVIVGWIRGPSTTGGAIALGVGLGLVTLATLESSAREHFAGFRSHALLLAAGPVVILEGGLYFAGLRGPLLIAVALPVYAALAYLLRSRYRDANELRALRR